MTAQAGLLQELETYGVVRLPAVFDAATLDELRLAAEACFVDVKAGKTLPSSYGFSPFSQSVVIGALRDYGLSSDHELWRPAEDTRITDLIRASCGDGWKLNPNQCWVRKRFAPANAPRLYQPNRWHQDGGLGVKFPMEPGPPLTMTRLVTCWIPLHACGDGCPRLEFVRRRMDELLHFTELDDARFRERFAPEEFWAPHLEAGDCMLFLAGCLHRTFVSEAMQSDRLSIEYRWFPE